MKCWNLLSFQIIFFLKVIFRNTRVFMKFLRSLDHRHNTSILEGNFSLFKVFISDDEECVHLGQ